MVSEKAAVMASGKPFESVHDRDQDVLDTPDAQFVHNRKPELGPLVVGDPEPEDLALPVPGDAQGDVDRLVLDHPTVSIADLDPKVA